MKEMRPLILLVLMGFVGLFAARWSRADTGPEGAVRRECGQYIVPSQVTLSSTVATALLTPADLHNAMIVVRNMSSVYKVYLGSSTAVTASNGYELAVATTTAGDNYLELGNLTGQLFAIAQAGGQALGSVSVLQCRTNTP